MTSPVWGCQGVEVAGTCVSSTAFLVVFSIAGFAWVAWSTHRRASS